MTMTWQSLSACTPADVDLFFPSRGESTAPAKAICATCPVSARCLEENLMAKHGIYGGTSERERRKLRRTRRLALVGAS